MADLVIDSVGHRFNNKKQPRNAMEVLRDINLQMGSGEFICVVGPSGCGKTTLLRVAAGLLKPTSGRVLLGDEVIQRPSQRMSVVFQSDSLFPWRTVKGNLEFGLEVQGKTRDREQMNNLLDMVGLQDFASYYPYELSGGMRQRVNLIRALATAPEVLMMDEPFASLDAQTREIMQMGLLSIWERDRKSVLFVTHQLEEAVYLADRVWVLASRPGRLKADVHIPLARPRSLDLKRTPEFMKYVDDIWNLIRDEVMTEGEWANRQAAAR